MIAVLRVILFLLLPFKLAVCCCYGFTFIHLFIHWTRFNCRCHCHCISDSVYCYCYNCSCCYYYLYFIISLLFSMTLKDFSWKCCWTYLSLVRCQTPKHQPTPSNGSSPPSVNCTIAPALHMPPVLNWAPSPSHYPRLQQHPDCDCTRSFSIETLSFVIPIAIRFVTRHPSPTTWPILSLVIQIITLRIIIPTIPIIKIILFSLHHFH